MKANKGNMDSLKTAALAAALLMGLFGCVSRTTYDASGDVVEEHVFDAVAAAKTRVQLGLTYLRSGDSAKAKMHLEKAEEFAPKLPEVYFSQGYYYQTVGEMALAEQAYRKAVDLDDENGEALNNFGAFLCRMGRYEESITYFKKAVRAPGYIRVAGAYENAGLCARMGDMAAEAEEYLSSALSHDPKRATSLLAMAELRFNRQDYGGAKGYLIRLQQVSQPSPQSLFMAIRLAKQTGDKSGVEKYGEELLEKFPDSPLSQRYRSNQF
ncbi:type IV pilus biogenesis/stability protein PilW [Gallaecimonas sp. GXIMD4217]|uniref:type IV pilus biogenesis/stability protein PilW n=1 Tax=Gallaecimonas sp. GXIMD4217 TaxID=3131927 RepID=UPI00311B402A